LFRPRHTPRRHRRHTPSPHHLAAAPSPSPRRRGCRKAAERPHPHLGAEQIHAMAASQGRPPPPPPVPAQTHLPSPPLHSRLNLRCGAAAGPCISSPHHTTRARQSRPRPRLTLTYPRRMAGSQGSPPSSPSSRRREASPRTHAGSCLDALPHAARASLIPTTRRGRGSPALVLTSAQRV
jgi:hypothetical protein